MRAINLTPVTSSQLAAIGYDEEGETLAIEFKSGGLYHYANFTEEDWQALQAAESVGSHFYRNIKPFPGKYPFRKIDLIHVTSWMHPSYDDALIVEGDAATSRAKAVEHFGSDHEEMGGEERMMPREEFESLPEFGG